MMFRNADRIVRLRFILSSPFPALRQGGIVSPCRSKTSMISYISFMFMNAGCTR